jgi:hypothetical protein
MAVIFFNPKSFLKVILTLEKSRVKITTVVYHGIFITLAPGSSVTKLFALVHGIYYIALLNYFYYCQCHRREEREREGKILSQNCSRIGAESGVQNAKSAKRYQCK